MRPSRQRYYQPSSLDDSISDRMANTTDYIPSTSSSGSSNNNTNNNNDTNNNNNISNNNNNSGTNIVNTCPPASSLVANLEYRRQRAAAVVAAVVQRQQQQQQQRNSHHHHSQQQQRQQQQQQQQPLQTPPPPPQQTSGQQFQQSQQQQTAYRQIYHSQSLSEHLRSSEAFRNLCERELGNTSIGNTNTRLTSASISSTAAGGNNSSPVRQHQLGPLAQAHPTLTTSLLNQTLLDRSSSTPAVGPFAKLAKTPNKSAGGGQSPSMPKSLLNLAAFSPKVSGDRTSGLLTSTRTRGQLQSSNQTSNSSARSLLNNNLKNKIDVALPIAQSLPSSKPPTNVDSNSNITGKKGPLETCLTRTNERIKIQGSRKINDGSSADDAEDLGPQRVLCPSPVPSQHSTQSNPSVKDSFSQTCRSETIVQNERDESLLNLPIQLGSKSQRHVIAGVTGLVHRDSLEGQFSEEVKSLVLEECKIIYECKICSNLFRSLVNFIDHKRSYCLQRSLETHQSKPMSSTAIVSSRSAPPRAVDIVNDLQLNEAFDSSLPCTSELNQNDNDTIILEPHTAIVDCPDTEIPDKDQVVSHTYNSRGPGRAYNLAHELRILRRIHNQDRKAQQQLEANLQRKNRDHVTNPTSILDSSIIGKQPPTTLSRLLQSKATPKCKDKNVANQDSALKEMLNNPPYALNSNAEENRLLAVSQVLFNANIDTDETPPTKDKESESSTLSVKPTFAGNTIDGKIVMRRMAPKRKFIEDCIRKVKRDKRIEDLGERSPDVRLSPINSNSNAVLQVSVGTTDSCEIEDNLTMHDEGTSNEIEIASSLVASRTVSTDMSAISACVGDNSADSDADHLVIDINRGRDLKRKRPPKKVSNIGRLSTSSTSQISNSRPLSRQSGKRESDQPDVVSTMASTNNTETVDDALDLASAQIPSCDVCKTDFKSVAALSRHVRMTHPSERMVYPCLFCSQSFTLLENVCRHMLDIHKKPKAQVARLREVVKSRAHITKDFITCEDYSPPAAQTDSVTVSSDEQETNKCIEPEPQTVNDLPSESDKEINLISIDKEKRKLESCSKSQKEVPNEDKDNSEPPLSHEKEHEENSAIDHEVNPVSVGKPNIPAARSVSVIGVSPPAQSSPMIDPQLLAQFDLGCSECSFGCGRRFARSAARVSHERLCSTLKPSISNAVPPVTGDKPLETPDSNSSCPSKDSDVIIPALRHRAASAAETVAASPAKRIKAKSKSLNDEHSALKAIKKIPRQNIRKDQAAKKVKNAEKEVATENVVIPEDSLVASEEVDIEPGKENLSSNEHQVVNHDQEMNVCETSMIAAQIVEEGVAAAVAQTEGMFADHQSTIDLKSTEDETEPRIESIAVAGEILSDHESIAHGEVLDSTQSSSDIEDSDMEPKVPSNDEGTIPVRYYTIVRDPTSASSSDASSRSGSRSGSQSGSSASSRSGSSSSSSSSRSSRSSSPESSYASSPPIDRKSPPSPTSSVDSISSASSNDLCRFDDKTERLVMHISAPQSSNMYNELAAKSKSEEEDDDDDSVSGVESSRESDGKSAKELRIAARNDKSQSMSSRSSSGRRSGDMKKDNNKKSKRHMKEGTLSPTNVAPSAPIDSNNPTPIMKLKIQLKTRTDENSSDKCKVYEIAKV